MADPSLKGKVLSVETESAYQGVVYTQSVDIETVGGIQLHLFDSGAIIDPELVGTEQDFGIMGIPKDGVRDSDEEAQIRESENPLSEWSYDFVGKVKEIVHNPDRPGESSEKTAPRAVLDIGQGSILLESSGELTRRIQSGLEVGDSLFVPCSRTEITTVYD